MPNSLQAVMTRTAISPRLAMRIFLNRTDGKQRLPVLHRLPVQHEFALENAGMLGFDLVHELHRLDDAEHFARLNAFAYGYERRCVGRCSFVKCADNGRFDKHEIRVDGRLVVLLTRRFYSERRRGDWGRRVGRCCGYESLLRGAGEPGAPDAHAIVAALDFQL